jgi:hypothetical protein
MYNKQYKRDDWLISHFAFRRVIQIDCNFFKLFRWLEQNGNVKWINIKCGRILVGVIQVPECCFRYSLPGTGPRLCRSVLKKKKKKKIAFRVFKDFLFLNRGELFFLSRLKTTSLLFYSVAKIESCCCWKLLLQCSRDPLKWVSHQKSYDLGASHFLKCVGAVQNCLWTKLFPLQTFSSCSL